MFIAQGHKTRPGNTTASSPRLSRAPASTVRPSVNPLWHRLATRVQTKLEVGARGDAFEQEADRVAERVMQMPDASLTSRSAITQRAQPPEVQRMCSSCEDELQKKSAGAPAGASHVASTPPASHSSPIRSGGQPLAPSARSFFEPRFSADFGNVRVHTDAQAADSARSLDALAYTIGSNIVFGRGQFAPESVRGKQLLAHELTHVIQQSPSNQPGTSQQPGSIWNITSLSSTPYVARRDCPDVKYKKDCKGRCGKNDKGHCEMRTLGNCKCEEPKEENPPSHEPTTLGMIGAALGSIVGGLEGATLGSLGGLPGIAYGVKIGTDIGADIGGATGDAIQSGLDWLFGD